MNLLPRFLRKPKPTEPPAVDWDAAEAFWAAQGGSQLR